MRSCRQLSDAHTKRAGDSLLSKHAVPEERSHPFLGNQSLLRMLEAGGMDSGIGAVTFSEIGKPVPVTRTGLSIQMAGKDDPAPQKATPEQKLKSFEPEKLQEKDVRRAIDQFKSSDAAKTPVGRRVAARLEDLYKEEEIGLEEMTAGLGGEYRPGISGVGTYDLALNEQQTYNAMALKMVHEAVHALEADRHTVDDEMAAFDFEADYYEELKRKKLVIPTEHAMNEHYLELKSKNRAVDILFPKYADLLDVPWIAKHKNDWGGLENRLGETRAAYVNTLLGEGNGQEDLIFSIVTAPIENGLEFRTMIERIGDSKKGDFNAGVRRLNGVFSSDHRSAFGRLLQSSAAPGPAK